MEYNYNEWCEIISKYRNGEIKIGVNLPLARQFLMTYTNKYSIWSISLWTIIPLVVCMSAITIYKLWGILFSIIYIITFLAILGISSYSFSKVSSCILTADIITVIILLCTSFYFSIPFILSVVSFITCYAFYYSIGKTILNDYALVYFDNFKYMIKNKIIAINKGID